MDRKSIERFKKTLQSRHCDLRKSLGQTQRESLTTQHDYGKDEGDRANTSLAREIDLGRKSRDRALLNAVDGALKRINEGRFGQCLHCEQEINARRLEAIPWVRYCITCQELIDRAN
jgi:DnaK suppressor protein